ncbi:EamA family transporter [Gilliamella apicola]|uniref:EamA family transporter n=1 Tax=Gilliamella apicola TaxID=1196095 RepID=UPI0009B87032
MRSIDIITHFYYLFFLFPVTDFTPYLQSDFILGLLYLVLFPSWLAYLFWNKGIMEIGATRGEIYTHLIPLSGGLFSIVFLNVEINWFHIVSAFLIIIGEVLCSKK